MRNTALPVLSPALVFLAALVFAATAVGSRTEALPTAMLHDSVPLRSVETITIPPIDREAVRVEDQERERRGLPPRYAIPHQFSIRPRTHGTWEDVGPNLRMWRLRVTSEDASSLNFGFVRYYMPDGAKLLLYASDGSHTVGPYTNADNEAHGELWTPVVLSGDVVIEVTVPADRVRDMRLRLAYINVGYRGFGEGLTREPGSCNYDVVCPIGDGWRDEISSVGVISTGGYTFCTGFMVNNTAQDGTPFFMTANHCGVDATNAASLVVYWNYESQDCGDLGGGSLDDNQTGSYFRAAYASSDFTLVLLDDAPDSAYDVTYAGWDRTDEDPASAVAIHHPDADVKCISFEHDPCVTTSYTGTAVPGDGTHIRVIDWDEGTTEPGSSGSPLFDQNHRVVGQLHGGFAACDNDESDWYGRFSVSWEGGGTSSTRLSDWLDPAGSGATRLDLYDPNASGLLVTPPWGLVSTGDAGGPFIPSGAVYTLENLSDTGIDYDVASAAPWLTIVNGSGYLSPGASAEVEAFINSSAGLLEYGVHEDVIQFTNAKDHAGDTTRDVTLKVGESVLVYGFTMDVDPGWSVEGDWAFGQPAGGGGKHGYPDPGSGHTGANVYGYNLDGDYAKKLRETHLTSAALDCSDLAAVTLKFWRYLGVEGSAHDRAYVRASNDGTSWTTVWQNGVDHVTDSSWVQEEYDISDIADGQETVYVRWTMGSTDPSWEFCGWNVDDVEIWAAQTYTTGVDGTLPSKALSVSLNYPNPFNPKTAIRFELPRTAHVAARVYDVAGRLVRGLVDAEMPGGPHELLWDGNDESGTAVGAGVYFLRLESEAQSVSRRMVLLR